MKKISQFRPSTIDELYNVPRPDKFVPPDFFKGELNWKHIAVAVGGVLAIGLIVYSISNYTVSTSNRKLLEELRPKLKNPDVEKDIAVVEEMENTSKPQEADEPTEKKPKKSKEVV